MLGSQRHENLPVADGLQHIYGDFRDGLCTGLASGNQSWLENPLDDLTKPLLIGHFPAMFDYQRVLLGFPFPSHF